jgi:integrase
MFTLLASTGLRISEAIALPWSDLSLDAWPPRLRVRRAIVRGIVGAPKSRHGVRTIPLTEALAGLLTERRPIDAGADDLVFTRPDGLFVRPEYLRRYVLVSAAERAGLRPLGLHALHHTCAALLTDGGANALKLERWMGHHSAAYTLETYGHLIDDELGPALTSRPDCALTLSHAVPAHWQC